MICGKICYETREQAEQAVKGGRSDSRRSKRVALRNVYFCRDCDKWHTSSQRTNNKGKKIGGLNAPGKRESKKVKQIRLEKANKEVNYNATQDVNKHLVIHSPRNFKVK